MAVLAVLAVHAWPEVLRGGFVGVDIFFVLSGYLITGLMLGALAEERFSLLEFYRRRVLRLFPALCTVLLCCAVAAVFTFPSEARQIGKHIAASAVFASNLALWQEAGYFDARSETKPLLHLWSLGIEEQFYLLWPLVLLAVWRWRTRPQMLLLGVVLGLLILSFALNVTWVVPKAKGTFFLLPTRAWELLCGAALAVWQHQAAGLPAMAAWRRRLDSTPLGRARHECMAAGGVLLIAAAFALLDKTAAFPGWWALLPTTGTVLLLAAGTRSGQGTWVSRTWLAHPVMQFYGRISYPLYLWHWPLLVFPVLWGWEMDNALRVAVLALSVGLATLTTDHIEAPLRFGPHSRAAPWALGGVMAAVGLAGLTLMLSNGLVQQYPPSVRAIAKADFAFDFGGYRAQRCFLDLEQAPAAFADECWPSAGQQGPVTLLWGDSHAASLYPGLRLAAGITTPPGPATSGAEPARFLAQFTKARCPPVAPVASVPPVPALASRWCEEANAHVMRLLHERVPDTVVLGGNWRFYIDDVEDEAALGAALRATVLALQALGVRQVVVLGQLPTWTQPLPRVLLRAWQREGAVPERSLQALDPRAWQVDGGVRMALAGTAAVFVSPHERLCNAQGCLVTRTRDGIALPLVHDESHLTVEGSELLVQLGGGALSF